MLRKILYVSAVLAMALGAFTATTPVRAEVGWCQFSGCTVDTDCEGCTCNGGIDHGGSGIGATCWTP